MGIVINHSENIFLPQMIITKPEMEEKVEAFVKNGGTVIVTYRHAVKDADNNVPFGETLPVHYNALAGLTVEETESLQDYDAFPVVGSGVFEGVEGTGGIFRDMIQVQDAEVLFHYADAFYLEFDDARSGDFRCLRHVSPDKKVVLGEASDGAGDAGLAFPDGAVRRGP